jgi:uncharacterized protein with GYD domain
MGVVGDLTEEGIKTIKDAPARMAKNSKALEAAGGKLIGFYMTMGAYDYIIITEWPSDEAAMSFLLTFGSTGIARTTTFKAFTQEEAIALINNLP